MAVAAILSITMTEKCLDNSSRSLRSALMFSSETEYAKPALYFGHRLRVIESWGAALLPGDTILELGCGDGYLARLLAERGYTVCACDKSPILLEKTRNRTRSFDGTGLVDTRLLDINEFPFELNQSYDHVFAVMRCFYKYAIDPLATLSEVCRLCRKKLILDFSPRRISPTEVLRHVHAAGFPIVRLRAFLVPQKRILPPPLQRILSACEEWPLIYRPLVRKKFHLWILAEK